MLTARLPPLEPEARLGAPLASPTMAEEVTYADLAIGPGKRHRNLHSLPQPGSKCSMGFFGETFGGFWAVVVLGDSHPLGGAGGEGVHGCGGVR